jgi:hypothetical protein
MPPFKIFISSTKEDLESYREAVRKKLEELKEEFDIEVIGMEDFGARTESPLETSLAEVSQSDMYIGIIGMRYGTVDETTQKSIVQLEYEKAIEKQLPIRVYIIDGKKGRIPPDSVQCEKIQQLNEFKAKLRKHTTPPFTTEEDLASRIELDIRKYLQEKHVQPKTKLKGILSIFKSPFISGTLKNSIVVKWDLLIIRGIATKAPPKGIGVWIFGKKFFHFSSVQVYPDDSFEFVFPPEKTKNMESGSYFVVLQHPMANGELDVFPISDNIRTIVKNTKNEDFFVVDGITSIRGVEAAESLIELMNTSGIDDSYTKLSFLVEDPWITIDPIEKVIVGKPMLIKGTTNISIDHDLLVEVKSQPIEISDIKRFFSVDGFGVLASISRGEGFNIWQTNVAQAVFKPGKYYVYVISDALGSYQKSEITAFEN